MSYCDTCCHKYSDICGTCETLDGVPIKYSKKTNADRIRAMTDEELAKLLSDPCPGDLEPADSCFYSIADGDDTVCVDCWLEWLKQEAGT